jgi:hypothetical protein
MGQLHLAADPEAINVAVQEVWGFTPGEAERSGAAAFLETINYARELLRSNRHQEGDCYQNVGNYSL